jgi:general secretion pathway protein G
MRFLGLRKFPQRRPVIGGQAGFTLVEMVITMAVMVILVMGVLPLVKMSVRRQKEEQLRTTLRDIRRAIEEFHRDTMGGPCDSASGPRQPPTVQPPGPPNTAGGTTTADPRSRVVISDCKIFKADNPDRFPPDLETLVSGVNVIPRGQGGGMGARGDANTTALEAAGGSSGAVLADKKKVYLRNLPVDPITGESEWDLRSAYQDKDAGSWDELNVFDVRSKAPGAGLNGEKYSDW